MSENGLAQKQMDTESIFIPLETNMKVCGKWGSNMAKEQISWLVETST